MMVDVQTLDARRKTLGTVKIQSFTQLTTWQKGHSLVLDMYRATDQFPPGEQFALTSQIRRAVVSFTSNIAEGFSRGSAKDKQHFYSMALSSLTEVQNQLLIARDLGYITHEQFSGLADRSVEIVKMTKGLMKKTTMSRPPHV